MTRTPALPLGRSRSHFRNGSSARNVGKLERLNASPRPPLQRLEDLPNVGPSLARDLRLLGIGKPADLRTADPYEMFDALCRRRGLQDPCVLDVFISVVDYMRGKPAREWWAYTEERKAHLGRR